MRALLAALALVASFMPWTANAGELGIHFAQMARDVTDAVRKQRAERRARARQEQQSDRETKR